MGVKINDLPSAGAADGTELFCIDQGATPATRKATVSQARAILGIGTAAANTVFAGPTGGGATTATFRSLVAADLPASGVTAGSYTSANITVDAYGRVTAAANGTGGGGGGGSGTVTSVAMTLPGFLSVSGSPITASGTLAVTLATQAANVVFAGPTTGAAAAPTFRAIVIADIATALTTPGPLGGTTPSTAAFTTISASGVASLSGGLKAGRRAVSNADTTITAADVFVAQTGTMSATRTWTLPTAASLGAGGLLIIADESGTVSATNPINLTRAGSDAINGATTLALSSAYGTTMVISDGVSKLTAITIAQLPGLASGKWLTNDGTSTSWGTIATTDISGFGSMGTQSSAAVAITGGTVTSLTSLTAAATLVSTSGTQYIFYSQIKANPASSSTAVFINSVSSESSSTTAQNFTDATAALVGLKATVVHGGTGTLTGGDCLQTKASTTNSSGTASTLRGLHCLDASKAGGTTITTLVGVDIENQTAGTTNFALRTGTGTVQIGDNVALFGTGSFGSGSKVVFIANATTNPSTNPTGGGVLYADSGALKWRGSGGTVTTLGPA